MTSDWANQIVTNGWVVKPQPDFVSTMNNSKVMRKIVPDEKKARQRVIDVVNRLLSLGPPTVPKVGYSKWLKGFVQIREAGIQGDWRLLYRTSGNSITLYCLANHKQVEKTSRDSNARVHNSPMDDYELADFIEEDQFQIDYSELLEEEIDQRNKQTISLLKERLGEREFDEIQTKFEETSERCSIFIRGEHGLELKTTEEQNKIVKESSPLLLPGVAGTGKSTVLQKRYVNSLLSADNDGRSEQFFEETLYLTLNQRLADQSREILQQLLPQHLIQGMQRTVLSLDEWADSLLNAAEQQKSFDELNKVGFNKFRKWWEKRTHLYKYDPAQLWEEYRGVIRGSNDSIDSAHGTIDLEQYLGLPKDRTTFPVLERESVYKEVISEFWDSLKNNDWDDQDKARAIFQLSSEKGLQIYRNIFIDEVQDLTELQLIALLSLVKPVPACHCNINDSKNCKCSPGCPNCNCLIFDATGDISQQVYPSKFRWEDTSRLIYDSLGIKCKLSSALNTSYRSMRCVVDLANWYLKLMNEENKQGLSIEQALTTEKGLRPSVQFGGIDDLVQSMTSVGLPLSYCPLIVRSEEQKRDLRERIKKKRNKKSKFKSELYVYTIAEIKGLEYNYVLAWDISSGSNHIMKRAHHELRSKYVGNEDWNLQMEYKHAFVAVTRTRELLHHLSLNHDEYEIDPLMNELIEQKLVIEQDRDEDLSHFANVEISDEELLQNARNYERAGLFESAADVYRVLGMEVEAEYCTFLAQRYDENPIPMAESARKLSKMAHGFAKDKIEQINRTSMERCQELIGNKKTKLSLELQSFHARSCGDISVEKRSKAELAELNARESKKDFLWKKAAELWCELEEFSFAAYAYKQCRMLPEAAKCYFNSNENSKLRTVMIDILNGQQQTPELVDLRIRLLIPSTLDARGKHVRVLRKIFGFFPTTQFKKLAPMYEEFDRLEISNNEHKQLLRKVDESRTHDSPLKKARAVAKRGDIFQALDIMREEGMFRQGLEEFYPSLGLMKLKTWLEINKATNYEKMDALRVSFTEIDDKTSAQEIINYFEKCPTIFSRNKEKLSTKNFSSVFDCAVNLIRNPKPITDENTLRQMETLVRAYISRKYCEEENSVIHHAIRYAMIRTLHATDLESPIIDLDPKEKEKLLLYICELIIKLVENPRTCEVKNYSRVREIVISMIEYYSMIDFIDCLFDWLLSASHLTLWKENRVALKDLYMLTRIYGNEDKPPNKTFNQSQFRFENGYAPEDIIGRKSSDMSLTSSQKKEIEQIFFNPRSSKGKGFMNEMSFAEEKEKWDDEKILATVIELLRISSKKEIPSFNDVLKQITTDLFDTLPPPLTPTGSSKIEQPVTKNLEAPKGLPEDDDTESEPVENSQSNVVENDEDTLESEFEEEQFVQIEIISEPEQAEQKVSIRDIVSDKSFIAENDHYTELKLRLSFEQCIQSEERGEFIYEWNEELREIIDDELVDNTVIKAAIWVFFDDIRKLLPSIGVIPAALSNSFLQDLKSTKDKVVLENNFWTLSWAQRILLLG